MRVSLKVAAWVLFGIICIMTVGPIWLRPMTQMPAGFERFDGFAITGLLFALAYSRHLPGVLISLIAAAGVLELVQTAIPSRHGTLAAFLFKAAGVVASVVAVRIGQHISSKHKPDPLHNHSQTGASEW